MIVYLQIYVLEISFQLTKTDTDSIYMAINKSSIDGCIKPTHHDIFQRKMFKSCSDEENPTGFPRTCCQCHLALDEDICALTNVNGKA